MLEPDFQKGDGLLPVIVQDEHSGEVLMLAYMNRAAWDRTRSSKEAHYFSRSRQKLWHKGESSGHVQKVKNLYLDCDQDTILLKVEQVGGAACHKGYRSCFYREIGEEGTLVCSPQIFDPREVY
ncbi:MAG: phosphoribosyl-AMP cyclohydrolase [Desulfohalobiaceae bacterium]|nr:phosphoribosyl-AMP cyclohydrolase [Desulfohalobiaceae bacterium]